MAFKFRRGTEDVEVTSKDIIGLSEEEVKTNFGKVDTLATKVEEQGTVLTAIKDSLAALEGKIIASVKPTRQENDTEDERTPEQKMQDFTLQTSLETKMLVVKSDVKSKQDKDGNLVNAYWEEFASEIDELTKADQLLMKTRPEYWQNAYEIVVGRHVKDIQDGKVKTRKRMFVEGGNDSSRSTTSQDVDKPSELDITQAAKFHIPIEKYMAQKKQMRFVS